MPPDLQPSRLITMGTTARHSGARRFAPGEAALPEPSLRVLVDEASALSPRVLSREARGSCHPRGPDDTIKLSRLAPWPRCQSQVCPAERFQQVKMPVTGVINGRHAFLSRLGTSRILRPDRDINPYIVVTMAPAIAAPVQPGDVQMTARRKEDSSAGCRKTGFSRPGNSASGSRLDVSNREDDCRKRDPSQQSGGGEQAGMEE